VDTLYFYFSILSSFRFVKMYIWDAAPCSLVDIDRRFKGTRRNVPAYSHIHTRRRENMKSRIYHRKCSSSVLFVPVELGIARPMLSPA
jgi:hypothetical protein